MNCKRCNGKCIKNGFQANGKQRFYCKTCQLSQQESYIYFAYKPSINHQIYKLINNSCGINDISRVLSISRHTVKKRLWHISKQTKRPVLKEYQQSYEIDEMKIKGCGMGDNFWVSYAINRNTKQVINFCTGRRTALQLSKIVNPVLLLNPKCIYTDRWVSYKSIIPKALHKTGKCLTNRIERFHLNLRTHLKCLSRKTICYSKSIKTLEAILRIYFWGHTINLKSLHFYA